MSKIKWLVMIYLSGNNNLSEECVFALTEMRRVGSDRNVTVVAQLDSSVYSNQPLFIEKDETPGSTKLALDKAAILTKQKRAKAPKRKALNYADEIFEFVEGSMNEHEATRYMVVLSGHAGGPAYDFLRRTSRGRTDSLSMPELGRLIERINNLPQLAGSKIDILGLDSCLMSTAEVAYMVQKNVKVMIGSEGFEPMTGWPYKTVLEELVQLGLRPGGGGDDEVKTMARRIVCGYIKYYTDYQAAAVSVDQAAFDLSQTVPLKQALRIFSDRMVSYLDDQEVRNALVLAHWEAQPYLSEQYVDLYDFCERFRYYCPAQKVEVHSACQNIMNVLRGSAAERDPKLPRERHDPELADEKFREIKDAFVLQSCYSGVTVQYSYGVSIYFPWAVDPADPDRLKNYGKLYLAADSNWGNFLAAYLQKTKRKMRGDGARRCFDVRQTSGLFSANVSFANVRNSGNDRNSANDRNSGNDRNLSNQIGSMRNPPTEFTDCICDPKESGNDSPQQKSRPRKPGRAPRDSRRRRPKMK
jgi:hypothetical protein